jgi:hypothetical protein
MEGRMGVSFLLTGSDRFRFDVSICTRFVVGVHRFSARFPTYTAETCCGC